MTGVFVVLAAAVLLLAIGDFIVQLVKINSRPRRDLQQSEAIRELIDRRKTELASIRD